jgi:hypothetical protein
LLYVKKIHNDVYIILLTILFMLDLVAYTILGFVPAFLALESAYHFVACKIPGTKSCIFRQVKGLVGSNEGEHIHGNQT